MINYDYMVVAEFVNISGFIVAYKKTMKGADKLAKEFFNKFSFQEPLIVIEKIPFIHRYSLNKNSLYLDRTKTDTSNGELSVSVVQIDCEKFSPHWFIKERQNSPYIIELFKEGNKYYDLFEETRFYTN